MIFSSSAHGHVRLLPPSSTPSCMGLDLDLSQASHPQHPQHPQHPSHPIPTCISALNSLFFGLGLGLGLGLHLRLRLPLSLLPLLSSFYAQSHEIGENPDHSFSPFLLVKIFPESFIPQPSLHAKKALRLAKAPTISQTVWGNSKLQPLPSAWKEAACHPPMQLASMYLR